MPIVVMVGVGCSPSPDDVEGWVPLAQFHELHVSVSKGSLSIRLGKTVRGGAPCPVALSDLSARLDGLAVPVVTRGSGYAGEDECFAPWLMVDILPPDAESVLEISDRSGTIRCELPNLRAARQAMLVPVRPWELKSGEPITVQWSPGGDVGLWGIALQLETTSGGEAIHVDGAVFEDDRVTFALPSKAPGAYDLVFGPAALLKCSLEGFFASVSSDFTTFAFTAPITIVP